MKRLASWFIILALFTATVLCACGDTEETDSASSATSSSTVSESDEAKFPLEAKKYDTTVTILTRGLRYLQQFVPCEEYEGSVINTAVEARNELIEEEYGITIAAQESESPANDIEASITANTADFDIVCDSVGSMIVHVTDSWFYSLNELIALDMPWWDQNANTQLTLSDKIFYVAGDAIFGDDIMTSAVFYNKHIWEERYQSTYGSIYDMVDNGKWTYDTMFAIAKDFAQPDENGQWKTADAYYGIVTDGYTGATMLTNGSGAVSAYKDEQNNIVLSGGGEASVKAFDKVYNVLNDTTISLYAEQFSPPDFDIINEMFITGHALFQIGYINVLLNIMENESSDKVNPGVLPLPKFDETQDNYHCGINVYWSNVLAIPVCNQANLEATAYTMELLGYYSSPESPFGTQSVTNAFYETSLKLQSVTDDNDSRMIDLISNSRIYDLGGAFNWGGNLIGLYSFNLYRGSNTLVSTWEAELPQVQQAMLDTIDAYQNSIN